MSNNTELKQLLKSKYNGIYDLSDLPSILDKFKQDTKPSTNKDTIKKIFAKYTTISKNKILINTDTPSYNTYDSLLTNQQRELINQQKELINQQKELTFYNPHTSSHINDVNQVDDDVSADEVQKHTRTFEKLCSLKLPAQRTEGWYAMRNNAITASDIGLCVGDEHYKAKAYFIVKKLRQEFTDNPNTYHGKKLEEIATMIYEYRMNVNSKEFSMIGHEKYSFLGASPDGIVSHFKKDNQHKTNIIGRMIEIKCPTTRKINTAGEEKGGICPAYYWDQVQVQLEVCDLDECDFWQCRILHYNDKDEFIKDTHKTYPYRSATTKFEKGVLIQLLPLEKKEEINEDTYNNIVYSNATFLYPTKIEMSPDDCDAWIREQEDNLKTTNPDKFIDKVMYWRLDMSHCITIKRNKKWFADNLPVLKQMWSRVEIARSCPEYTQMYLDYYDTFIKPINITNAYKQHDLIDKRDKLSDKLLEICDKLIENKDNKKEQDKIYKKVMKEINEEK